MGRGGQAPTEFFKENVEPAYVSKARALDKAYKAAAASMWRPNQCLRVCACLRAHVVLARAHARTPSEQVRPSALHLLFCSRSPNNA